MTKVAIGTLVYLNENVFKRRQAMVRQSLNSLSCIADQPSLDHLVVNNGGGKLAEDTVRETVPGRFCYVDLTDNFFDVAIHICTLLHAKSIDAPYLVINYDDFVHYDNNWVTDAVEFMDMNPDISCIRLTEYDRVTWRNYDKGHVSTHINPDSVRHTKICPPKFRGMLSMSQPVKCGSHDFYSANWYGNSRPTMWRTDVFEQAIGDISGPIPVMQTFESRLTHYADTVYPRWLSGFLNMGVCRTFPVATSERVKGPAMYEKMTADGPEIIKQFNDRKRDSL